MPTPTYTPLATVTLGASASSVTFSSIPATYRDLILVISATGTDSAERLRFNGDTGTNYSYVRMLGNGSTTASASLSGEDYIRSISFSLETLYNVIIQIMDYSATDKHKTTLGRGNNASTNTIATAGRWANTDAINSINYSLSSGSFASGSTFSIYGIAS